MWLIIYQIILIDPFSFMLQGNIIKAFSSQLSY